MMLLMHAIKSRPLAALVDKPWLKLCVKSPVKR